MAIIAFTIFTIGFMLLFGLSLSDFDNIGDTKDLRGQVKKAKSKQQANIFTHTVSDVRQILTVQGHPGAMILIWVCSLLLALIGASLSAAINNVYLAPVFMVTLFMLPFLAVKMYWHEHEKRMNESLEVALNSITTSYLHGNNTILRAVEESLPYLKEPVAQVFRRFITQATIIDASTDDALAGLKDLVHNSIFSQWIDVVMQSQRDHNLKDTLPRILDKFSDLRTVNGETEIIMQEPRRTFFIMLIVAIVAPFSLYFLNKDWWEIILVNPIGKVLLAIDIAAVAFSLIYGITAMQPLQGEDD